MSEELPVGAVGPHPGDDDPGYLARVAEIAAQAAGPGVRPDDIAYLPEEDAVWTAVHRALRPAWEARAAAPLLDAWDRLALPADRVPQLREVGDRLEPIAGFRYEAVGGLVPKEQFFGALAAHRFLSTQHLRHPAAPLYTPLPDVIHELAGHAHCLAEPRLARLHVLAGEAMTRLARPECRQFVADVFWFSGEFGVVRDAGRWAAYGAGLLSSHGELGWFADHAHIRPVDPAAMGSLPYDIAHYQPVLFGAEDLDEVLEVVGQFFASATDEGLARLAA